MENLSSRYGESTHVPLHPASASLSPRLLELLHLLPLRRKHRYTVMKERPGFRAGCTVCAAHVRVITPRAPLYPVAQKGLTALKSCALPVHPSAHPTPQDHRSSVCVLLPFPECLMFGTTRYVAFLDWLCPRIDVSLTSVFSWPR